jgi:hypothetical protein
VQSEGQLKTACGSLLNEKQRTDILGCSYCLPLPGPCVTSRGVAQKSIQRRHYQSPRPTVSATHKYGRHQPRLWSQEKNCGPRQVDNDSLWDLRIEPCPSSWWGREKINNSWRCGVRDICTVSWAWSVHRRERESTNIDWTKTAFSIITIIIIIILL